MNNLVSIVVPAYNVEKYIVQCLKSIQKQTFINWEAIIVDDGSTDNTVKAIEAVIQHDHRFRLIRHHANGGVSKARNTGLLAAKGEYLAFLDGDDMWEPSFLAELIDTITANDVDMAYCGYTHLYTNGLRRKFSYPYASGHILFDVIQGKTQIHIGAMVVKKLLVEHAGLLFTEGCLVGQDQEFIWKLICKANVQAVPKELMLYRIRTGSAITAKWNWQKHIHAFYGFKRAAEYILAQVPLTYDKQKLSQILYERIGYKLYKIIWRMLKNSYDSEARQLLAAEESMFYLSYLQPKQLSIIDRLKYKLVCSEKEIWWKLARLV